MHDSREEQLQAINLIVCPLKSMQTNVGSDRMANDDQLDILVVLLLVLTLRIDTPDGFYGFDLVSDLSRQTCVLFIYECLFRLLQSMMSRETGSSSRYRCMSTMTDCEDLDLVFKFGRVVDGRQVRNVKGGQAWVPWYEEDEDFGPGCTVAGPP